jgi:hypothetical protein
MYDMARRPLHLLPGHIAILLGICIGCLMVHFLADGPGLFSGANAPWRSTAEANSGDPADGSHHHDEVVWPGLETTGRPDALAKAVSVYDLQGPSCCLPPLLPPPKSTDGYSHSFSLTAAAVL